MGGGYWQGIQNVFFRLVIPTLLFSTIIYLPKVLFHGGDVTWGDYFFDVFGGISYWFTSALVVAQVVLLTLLLFKRRSMGFYVAITFLLAGLGLWLNLGRTSTSPETYFPWFYKTGLEYTFVMVLGGLYYRHEAMVDKTMKFGWVLVAGVYVWLIAATWETHSLKMMGLSGICNALGGVAILCGIALIILLSKQLHRIKWLEFIGRNSIVFYFFSGVIPAACGLLAQHVVPEGSYLVTLSVAVVSVLLSYGVTRFVVCYMPFLTDFRKFFKAAVPQEKAN